MLTLRAAVGSLSALRSDSVILSKKVFRFSNSINSVQKTPVILS